MGEPRSGQGFDVHPWAPGRSLWLAGVLFEGEAGLQGHSDGDAVCHAVADALLGAAVMGDIGEHFPERDPGFAGITGPDLLARTVALLGAAGFTPVSIDLTVICDRPAIEPRRAEMRTALASALGMSAERVSVKATRPEGLGLAGDGVGCMALATISEDG